MELLALRRVRGNGFPRRAAGWFRGFRPRWVVATGIAVAAVVTLVAFLIAGTGPAGPRALTSDEANRLAITRFRNFQAGGRAVTITAPATAGGLVIAGSIDYRAKIGYGVVHGTGRDTSSDGLIEWTATTVAVHPMANPPGEAPATPPEQSWYSRPLRTSGSSLDTGLAVALGLGSDRPDNAQLLPQNGAEWTAADQVNGHQVEVMTGPTTGTKSGEARVVRYWIGSDGTMYRVRADVASQPEPVVIDFDTGKYVPVQPVPGLTPAR